MKPSLFRVTKLFLVTALMLAAFGTLLPATPALAHPATDGEPPQVTATISSAQDVAPLMPHPPSPAWDFGEQWINTTSYELTLTIEFLGPDPVVYLGQATMSGAFNILNDHCSDSWLWIGDTCTIGITFSPTLIGYQIGTLSIPTDLFFTFSTDFAGTGINPVVGLNAANHDFGNQLVGTTSAPFAFIVTNTGTTTLVIGTLGISGEFALSANNCNGANLAPSGTCTFSVTFSPLSIGPKGGSVTFTSNAFFPTNTIALSGNGIQPDLTITKTNNVGGSVVYPSTWLWIIKVTNNGTDNATFANGQTILSDNLPTNATYAWNYTSMLVIPGNNFPNLSLVGSDLTVTANGAFVLPPGAWVEVAYTVTATPGTYTNPRAGGSCSVDPNNVVPESAEGNNACAANTVTVTAPIISLSATSLNFGDLLVGLTSPPQSVIVTNTGNAPLHIGLLSFTSDWTVINDTCSNATVAPSGTCTFDVVFNPHAPGPLTGSVNIPSDAYSGPNSVALSGTGLSIPPGTNLLLNPGFDAFGSAPKAWNYSVLNVPVSSLADCHHYLSVACSLKLAAPRSTAIVTQTVAYNGVGGQQFIYGLTSESYIVPATGTYKFEIALFDRFSRVMFTQFQTFTNGTHSWETRFGVFTSPAAFTKLRYRIYFQKSVGWAWFDDAFLMLWP